jgi:predicted negative regulator of RcsB-dependent stress response
MPSLEDNSKQHALSREWMAARIIVIGGFAVAIAIAGYFAYRVRQETLAEQQASAPVVVTPKHIDAKTLARLELAICSAELLRAKDAGIVPQYGDLATASLAPTNVARRFICVAKTALTKYFIGADLRCDNLADPRCVSLYRVVLKDGTLLYSRPK